MVKPVAKAREKSATIDSSDFGDDFVSVFGEQFAPLDVDEHGENYWNTQVAETYNRLASYCNLRRYFERAESALGFFDSQEISPSSERRSARGFLGYVVPGKPRFASDDAKKLYLHILRVVEAQRKLKLVYGMIEEQHLKTIRENLNIASDLRAEATKPAFERNPK